MDLISLIERGYEPQPGPEAWARALMKPIGEASPARSLGHHIVWLHGPGGPERVVAHNAGPISNEHMLGALHAWFASIGAERQQTVTNAAFKQGIATALEVTGAAPQGEGIEHLGAPDSAVVVVSPVNHAPLVFATPSASPLRLGASDRALWRRITAHLAAGCRLAGRLDSTEADDVECVLSPEGGVLHAEGPAKEPGPRERLRDAVLLIDRARSRRGRADPQSAVDLWRGLFAGRWSLVDHFDADGKRFLLARHNDPSVPGPAALPLRQRQVLFYVAAGFSNKEIAYTLGIGETTVAVHVQRGLSSLGLSDRFEWIRIAAEIEATISTQVSAQEVCPNAFVGRAKGQGA